MPHSQSIFASSVPRAHGLEPARGSPLARGLKLSSSNFVVEEIMQTGRILETGKRFTIKGSDGPFTRFVLQKRDWSTPEALKKIARALHVSIKRFSFAGTKDKRSVSTQLCSTFGIEPRQLLATKLKDINILAAWRSRQRVRLGELGGNRFTITLPTKLLEKVKHNANRLKRRAWLIPNFFGPQRFGAQRGNTALVGKLILQRNWREAVLNYLTFTDPREKLSFRRARTELATALCEARGDASSEAAAYKCALSRFPRTLRFERSMLARLAEAPRDYIGALRALPAKLRLMFIHAYQATIFNTMLEQRNKTRAHFVIKTGEAYCPTNALHFPAIKKVKRVKSAAEAKRVRALARRGEAFLLGTVVGYASRLTIAERRLLALDALDQKSFLFSDMPELCSAGTLRPLFVPIKNFELLSTKPLTIRFSLPKGSYATVALMELLK